MDRLAEEAVLAQIDLGHVGLLDLGMA